MAIGHLRPRFRSAIRTVQSVQKSALWVHFSYLSRKWTIFPETVFYFPLFILSAEVFLQVNVFVPPSELLEMAQTSLVMFIQNWSTFSKRILDLPQNCSKSSIIDHLSPRSTFLYLPRNYLKFLYRVHIFARNCLKFPKRVHIFARNCFKFPKRVHALIPS